MRPRSPDVLDTNTIAALEKLARAGVLAAARCRRC